MMLATCERLDRRGTGPRPEQLSEELHAIWVVGHAQHTETHLPGKSPTWRTPPARERGPNRKDCFLGQQKRPNCRGADAAKRPEES
eukprot:2956195-Pyramimonas_sp.AAC.1